MTIYGWLELGSFLGFAVAIFFARFRWRILAGSLFLLLGTLALHLAMTESKNDQYRLFDLPESPPRAHFLERLIDERDLVFAGTSIYAPLAGALPFGKVFDVQYDALGGAIHWPLATPILSALSANSSHDRGLVMEFAASGKAVGKPAIFLHGAMGSYVVQCWLVASILRGEGYQTYCPSLSFRGNWSGPTGKAVLERTLRYVESKHPSEKILFVGLSNGGMALGKYRARLAPEAAAFVYLAGGAEETVRDPVPTLLIWGKHDNIIPLAFGERIHALNPSFKLIVEATDHSALVREHAAIAEQITKWLKDLP